MILDSPASPATVTRSLISRISYSPAFRPGLLLAAIVAVFCVLASGVAGSKRPWCDEGWLADIAYNLIHHGVMGLTILDPHGFVYAPLVEDIDRYTYWVMPGYIFFQAAWYEVFGLTLFTMRALSIAWGIVALGSLYIVVRHLTRSRSIALIAVLVLAADQHFVVAAASGRMDMMCAALCLAASAVYVSGREHFEYAILASCSLLAAALLTHPNALFGVILLSLIVFHLDRSRVRFRTVLIASIPFLAALGVWALYVLRAPNIFWAQMQAQTRIPHRLEFDWNIFRQVVQELDARYASAYRLKASSVLARLTGIPVLLYFLSLVTLAVIPTLRKRAGAKLILLLAVVDFSLLSCLQPNWYYLVYVLPIYAAGVGLATVWLWEHGTAGKWAATLFVATIVALGMSVNGFRLIHNDYQHRYLPAIEFLKRNAGPDALVMGSAELSFNLGFEGQVLDDCRLGFTSHKVPDYIVLEAHYRMFWFPWLAEHEPQTYRYITNLLQNNYELAYDQSGNSFRTIGSSDLPYQIYKRRTAPEELTVHH